MVVTRRTFTMLVCMSLLPHLLPLMLRKAIIVVRTIRVRGATILTRVIWMSLRLLILATNYKTKHRSTPSNHNTFNQLDSAPIPPLTLRLLLVHELVINCVLSPLDGSLGFDLESYEGLSWLSLLGLFDCHGGGATCLFSFNHFD